MMYVLYADDYVQDTFMFIGVYSSPELRAEAQKSALANNPEFREEHMQHEDVALDDVAFLGNGLPHNPAVIALSVDDAKMLEVALEAARATGLLWSDKVHAIDVGLTAIRAAIKEVVK